MATIECLFAMDMIVILLVVSSLIVQHKIALMMLPLHTSHLLQPLDVSIFGPLKKALTRALSPLNEAQLARIQKVEWLESYLTARDACFTTQNINSAWQGA